MSGGWGGGIAYLDRKLCNPDPYQLLIHRAPESQAEDFKPLLLHYLLCFMSDVVVLRQSLVTQASLEFTV